MSLCPDCNSDTILTDTGNNIWVLGIIHDDTCPSTIKRTYRKDAS